MTIMVAYPGTLLFGRPINTYSRASLLALGEGDDSLVWKELRQMEEQEFKA